MVPETKDVVPCLLHDILLEGLGEVVNVAGIHEILPEQNTVLIAEIVELIGGIIAATPDPEAVEIGKYCCLHISQKHLSGQSGIITVVGDIVSSSCEDLLSVDGDGKFLAPLVILSGNRHRTKTDAVKLLLGLLALALHEYADRIKGLLSASVRPPESRLLDFHAGILSQIEKFSVRIHNLIGKLHLCVRILFHIGGHRQRYLTFLVFLANQGVHQTGFLVGHKLDLTENAGIRKLGTPVPAKHAVGFSDILVARHRAGVAHMDLAAFCGFVRLDKVQRGSKVDFQEVVSLFRIFFDVKSKAAVHVFCVAQFVTVEIKVSHGVDAIEDQKHMTGFKLLRAYGKMTPDVKIVAEKFPHLILVLSIVGIGQNACLHKGVHGGTRNGHGIPVLGSGYPYFKRLFQLSFHLLCPFKVAVCGLFFTARETVSL